jgi:hypothetical protein
METYRGKTINLKDDPAEISPMENRLKFWKRLAKHCVLQHHWDDVLEYTDPPVLL